MFPNFLPEYNHRNVAISINSFDETMDLEGYFGVEDFDSFEALLAEPFEVPTMDEATFQALEAYEPVPTLKGYEPSPAPEAPTDPLAATSDPFVQDHEGQMLDLLISLGLASPTFGHTVNPTSLQISSSVGTAPTAQASWPRMQHVSMPPRRWLPMCARPRFTPQQQLNRRNLTGLQTLSMSTLWPHLLVSPMKHWESLYPPRPEMAVPTYTNVEDLAVEPWLQQSSLQLAEYAPPTGLDRNLIPAPCSSSTMKARTVNASKAPMTRPTSKTRSSAHLGSKPAKATMSSARVRSKPPSNTKSGARRRTQTKVSPTITGRIPKKAAKARRGK
jgi:hypothetical protein